MCSAATIALLGLILLALSPRKTPEETVALVPGVDSPGSKVGLDPDFGTVETALGELRELAERSVARGNRKGTFEALERCLERMSFSGPEFWNHVRLGQDLRKVGEVLTSIADREHMPEYQLAMAWKAPSDPVHTLVLWWRDDSCASSSPSPVGVDDEARGRLPARGTPRQDLRGRGHEKHDGDEDHKSTLLRLADDRPDEP